MKKILLGLASAAICAAAAADTVSYDVAPSATFPADGASVASVQRIALHLTRGFGAVGYDRSADKVKAYIEKENGERIALVNAAGSRPMLDPGWGLEEMEKIGDVRADVYKDVLYNRLFTRTLGWNGGDGVLTVGLPGGNVFWTFNDSFYGVVDAKTRARGDCSFPRNTIMVQHADDQAFPVTEDDALQWMARFQQTDNPNAAGYYKAYTHLEHPKATNFNGDGIAQDFLYWSGDGTVQDGKLKVLWNSVDTSTGSMIAMGTCLATYSLEGEPGGEGYLALESADHHFLDNNPFSYGSTLWEDPDGHIYLYSAIGNGQWLGNDPICARTVTDKLDGEWEYYIKDAATGTFSWQRTYPTEEQAKISGITARNQGSYVLPWIFRKGNKYYMCAQTFPFGTEMNILESDHPWGPFGNKKTLIRFPNPLDDLQGDCYGSKYRFVYMLNLHPALSRNGEIVISTNTDIGDTDDNGKQLDLGWLGGFARNFGNPGSADWYRPFFYRVYGWESLFDSDHTMQGATDLIEFATEDGTPLTEAGRYKFVCEAGAFGDELFETSGFGEGRSNRRIEINFTVDGSYVAVEAPAGDTFGAAPVYYNLQGVEIAHPAPGTPCIERRGAAVTKKIFR